MRFGSISRSFIGHAMGIFAAQKQRKTHNRFEYALKPLKHSLNAAQKPIPFNVSKNT